MSETLRLIKKRVLEAETELCRAIGMWEYATRTCEFRRDGELDCGYEGYNDPVCTAENCSLV